MRQDFLGQHGQRYRPDMATGFRALNHDRIGAKADQPAGEDQCGCEADQFRAAVLDRFDGGAGWDASGQDDVGDFRFQADPDQVIQSRMHGDQVDSEGFAGHRLGRRDFRRQQIGRHGATGNHAKAAGIGNRRYEMTFADPAHGAAHDGDWTAQKRGAAGP